MKLRKLFKVTQRGRARHTCAYAHLVFFQNVFVYQNRKFSFFPVNFFQCLPSSSVHLLLSSFILPFSFPSTSLSPSSLPSSFLCLSLFFFYYVKHCKMHKYLYFHYDVSETPPVGSELDSHWETLLKSNNLL